MTHALSVGAVVAVRALDAWHADTYNGLADVVAVDGDRVQVYLRTARRTQWCEVHGDRLAAVPFGPRLTWEAT